MTGYRRLGRARKRVLKAYRLLDPPLVGGQGPLQPIQLRMREQRTTFKAQRQAQRRERRSGKRGR